MSALVLRPLRREDSDRVAALEGGIAGRSRRGFLERRFAVAEAMPDAFITCAAVDGKTLAGYGFARVQEGEFGIRGTAAVLDVLGVDPDFRGQGIGKAVIADIERQLGAKRIGTLRTQVAWANQGMVRFFASSGFLLAPFQIIERGTTPLEEEVAEVKPLKPEGRERGRGRGEEIGFGTLARDRLPVRSLREEDLAAVVRIDRKLTGFDRSAYYAAKFREVLVESGIRVSLVAEEDGIVTGFIMARVDFGEFGQVETSAVIDTIGVHPAFGGSGIGHALLSQLLLNLSTLQVETVLVQLSQENFTLQRFLHARGFAQSQRLVLAREIR